MFVVAALYHFTRFEAPDTMRVALENLCRENGLRGTILLAREGINGTVAGDRPAIDTLLEHIRALPGCDGLEVKESYAHKMPFRRMRVRLKREIVTKGQPDVDPTRSVGRYVDAANWNELIAAQDVAVIDTRNSYEVAIGSFAGAENPQTDSFRDFPAWWSANRDRFEGKRIAMFCTGGIRCEKSTNYLLGQGVEEVFHLKGGILKYLEEVPAENSSWKGECFVFDERVSVGHGLRPGPHTLCRACRYPLAAEDLLRSEYEEGVACHHCIATRSSADRDRYRERQRQIALAARLGEKHLG